MNKIFARLLLIIVALTALAPAVQADVLLSELCDPRNDYLTDRYIEIYNAGASAVDLTGWKIVAVGNSSEIFTWNLSGSIAPGEALVAAALNTVDVFPVDFADDGWTSANATWNGKIGDGARLKNNLGAVIDDVVVPGTTFENDTMVRNENITAPAASFNLAEWTITPILTPSEATPGTHHYIPVLGPDVSAVTTLPASPLPGVAVNVEATVIDTGANITGVTLNWGTAAGVLTNAISMTNTVGDTYATTTAIPGQLAGVTVYYAVTADNDLPATTTSDELNYSPPFYVTVQDIQGVGAVSPHLGHEVISTGVVTAAFGTSFVIQAGSGQYSGVWVEGVAAPAVGSFIEVRGVVQEIDANTTITSAQINSTASGTVLAPEMMTTDTASLEEWEGVLVQVVNVSCTLSDTSIPVWQVNNSSTDLAVDDLGINPALILGTEYNITGPLSGKNAAGGVVPRDAGDIVFVADTVAPIVYTVETSGPTFLQVTYSEDVSAATALIAGNYSLTGSTISNVSLEPGQPDVINLTVTAMANGSQTLTINGVEDLYSNVMVSVAAPFYYYGGNVPIGYYDPAEGLIGEPLRGALKNIVDGHYVISYTALWSAYYTTDVKPNGKVWDMYSDVPGGIPPYEYTLGVDQGGSAGTEGTGYNREHSWPSSWYGATSPMYTDIFMVVPTDNDVNNKRGSYPFGETVAPTHTTLNGCKVGPNSTAGYTGTIFEPIDEYKGDFARAYFYMTTRYYGQDAGWPGSAMTFGANLLPWAETLLLTWHDGDPVSAKEVDRNEAVFAIQGNRNPFIDRPDFVLKMFKPELSAAPLPVFVDDLTLYQNVPNPFNPSTTISYELKSSGQVDLQIFDVAGHLVRTLYSGSQVAGRHEKIWMGRDHAGRTVATGVYFYRLKADNEVATRRMLLAK